MRVESDHAERLRTVLAGHPVPQRGPRRALLEVSGSDDLPTVRRVVQVPMRPMLPGTRPPPISSHSALSPSEQFVDEKDRDPAPTDAGPAPEERPRGVVAGVRSFTVRHLQAIGILVVVALVFTSVQLLRAAPSEVPLVEPALSAEVSSPSPPGTPSVVPLLLVHVAGAVKNPGVVQVPQGARVNDAIAAAGGITPEAHLGTLNLAAVVSDGMQILVGSGPQQTSTTSGGRDSQAPPGESGGARINLNTATQAQLESLPGVGPATAAKILAWRDQHGRFSKVEELQEIDGIGQKTFERLQPLVTV
ncbi:helix-hairpin-helix domain-containing protein [Tessaracoccus sp. SD287]|uniref:helix-hairpin-helix domain-containing protein n=1 Tax=Tessaracoccus sp. SD287 TaxID=2782008 RepID=UPI001F604854|nr:helix-hairpin-helix domain-containing protein [Tessaracoccus sp. SD287]